MIGLGWHVRARAGFAVLAGFVLSGISSAQPAPAPDPHVLLKQADEAIRDLHSFACDAEAIVQSEMSNAQTRWRGHVTVQFNRPRSTDVDGHPLYSSPLRVEYSVATELDRQPRDYLVISDGVRGIWVDRAQKTFRRGRLPAEQARVILPAEPLLMAELFFPEPLEDALQHELRYIGRRRVEGVECDVVHASDTREQGGTRWYLATTDHLPRRVERRPSLSRGPATTLELRNLTVDSDPPTTAFNVQPPDGCAEEGGQLLARGSLAPQWALSTLDGLKRSLADQRGSVCIVVFWAAWNPACEKMLLELEGLRAKLRDNPLRIFAISIWENGDDQAVRKAVLRAGATYTVLRGSEEVLRAYRATVVPTIYVIDREGRICFSAARMSNELMEQTADAVMSALSD